MKQRILIVDDEDIIGETLESYLETHGYEVESTTEAVGLVEKLDNEVYNLVILDLALADADGLEVLEVVKQTHPRLPVLILTGMGYDDELMKEAMKLRADGYMSKTVALPHLATEVRRILRTAGSGSQASIGK